MYHNPPEKLKAHAMPYIRHKDTKANAIVILQKLVSIFRLLLCTSRRTRFCLIVWLDDDYTYSSLWRLLSASEISLNWDKLSNKTLAWFSGKTPEKSQTKRSIYIVYRRASLSRREEKKRCLPFLFRCRKFK